MDAYLAPREWCVVYLKKLIQRRSMEKEKETYEGRAKQSKMCSSLTGRPMYTSVVDKTAMGRRSRSW